MPTSTSDQLARLRQALDWWQAMRERWRAQAELNRLGDAEAARLAHDIGLSLPEFEQLASEPANRPLLLERRFKSLGFDAEDIRAMAPLLLRDLERTCACCDVKARCAADFNHRDHPDGWQSYCPNAGTLESLPSC